MNRDDVPVAEIETRVKTGSPETLKEIGWELKVSIRRTDTVAGRARVTLQQPLPAHVTYGASLLEARAVLGQLGFLGSGAALP